uniref:hypothetical protein n=1 Tax=Mesorhizobium sp. dw_380 TaxID=2812001 RepID=UPI001BDF0C3E
GRPIGNRILLTNYTRRKIQALSADIRRQFALAVILIQKTRCRSPIWIFEVSASFLRRWRAQGAPMSAGTIEIIEELPEQKAFQDIVTVSIIISCREAFMGRGILLWLLGVPIPIIILLMLFMR